MTTHSSRLVDLLAHGPLAIACAALLAVTACSPGPKAPEDTVTAETAEEGPPQVVLPRMECGKAAFIGRDDTRESLAAKFGAD